MERNSFIAFQQWLSMKIEWFKMKKNSFVEGTIIATVAIILVKIMGMLYVIPFYAIVGEQGSALYAYAYNIYLIFLDISSAGIPIAISKIISEYNTLGMMDAKVRAFSIGKKIVSSISIVAFIILFLFARSIATLIIGNLSGGNTIEDVAFVIRCVSFAVLVIPYLSVSKGYLQGHKFIAPPSKSQVIEQVARITFILVGIYLSLKVFELSLRIGVGFAVFGATIGGMAALIYIYYTINKNKKNLSLDSSQPKDKVTNKEIRNKIIKYAIPLIIVNTAVSIYNITDLVLIMRTLEYLKFDAKAVEYIASSITTWGPKINMIIGSLATGMSVSLIPAISSAFALKKWPEVNSKLNKAMQIILVVSIPMTVGISLLSRPIWTVFYNNNPLGASILSLSIFVALFLNLCIVTTSTLQSLNKFKWVYISTIAGFLTNALLDVPLMILFNKIGISPFYGAISATLVGYTVSIAIVLVALNKEHKMNYQSTLSVFTKLIVPTSLMVIAIITLKTLFPFTASGKLMALIYGGALSVVGALIYLFTSYKMGIIDSVFGKNYTDKIIKKLTFKR